MTNSEFIKNCFLGTAKEAILECQRIISEVSNFQTYQEFVAYHTKHAQSSSCQKEWNTPTMAIHCSTCAVDLQSCICLECFLAGNHEGHNILLRPDSVGNCDCGDTSLWKRQGFCTKHQGLAQKDTRPQDYLDPQLQNLLTDVIFKGIFDALQDLLIDKSNAETVEAAFQFLTSFLQFGDGFRRLIAIALTEKTDCKAILTNVVHYCAEFNELFSNFCGMLINDRLFAINSAYYDYDFFLETIYPNILKAEDHECDISNYAVWDHVWFHNFSRQPSEYNILTRHWDWVSYAIKFLQIFKTKLGRFGKPEKDTRSTLNGETLNALRLFTSIDSPEKVQELLDRFSTEILATGSDESIKAGTNDFIVVSSHFDQTENMAYQSLFHFYIYFTDSYIAFANKPQLKFDTFVQQASQHCDISSIFIKDKESNGSHRLIHKYANDTRSEEDHQYYYLSFHNGASFFYMFPYYDALVYLFKNDPMTRFKLGQLFLQDQYQDVRIKLLIVALKKMLSISLVQQSIIRRRCNSGLDTVIIQHLNSERFATFSNAQQYPIVQFLLGLQNKKQPIDLFSLKEFFAYEMARETGIFDCMVQDDSKEHYTPDFYPGNNKSNDYADEDTDQLLDTMLLSYIYHLLIITVDRTLFNYDSSAFLQEQIIFHLKNKPLPMDKLTKCVDKTICHDIQRSDPSILISILQKVAIKTQGKGRDNDEDDSSAILYSLKPDIKVNSISGINSFSALLTMISKDISKNPNKLYQIQDFESEDTYFFKDVTNMPNDDETRISLKDLLLTPTVLAILFHTLNKMLLRNGDKATSTEHLAMNTLLLAYKSARDNKESDFSIDPSLIIRYRSIFELVKLLRILLFNYHENDDGSASLTNSLNERSFKQFLHIKIAYLDEEPKSFVDILTQKGDAGKDLLNQMSIDLGSNTASPTKQNNISQEKKNRASELKANIMKQYKNMIQTSNVLEQEDMQPDEIELETCSVCSLNKTDELPAYPIFMFKTKLPFIFDKPSKLIGNVEAELEVDSCIDEIIDSKDENQEEEDLDSKLLSPAQIRESIHADIAELESILDLRIESGELPEESREIYRQMNFQILQQKYREIQDEQERLQLLKEKRKNQAAQKKKKEELLQQFAQRKNEAPTPRMYTYGLNYMIQFSACQHLIHSSCTTSRPLFSCPIDRTQKNGLLPCFDGFPKELILQDNDTLTEPAMKSISLFLADFKEALNVNQESFDIFAELIKSLSGVISTYEMRIRTLPSCLDSKKTFILSRNLFLTIWYAYRMLNKPPIVNKKPYPVNKDQVFVDTEIEKEMTQFQMFVKRLIECDEIDQPNVFDSIVSEFINSPTFSTSTNPKRKDKELCLFLRRACLSKHFLLGQDVSGQIKGFVDWDESLSIPELINQFHATFPSLKDNEEFEFKSFTFGQLPKEYLRLAEPPYKFPVELTSKNNFYRLLDYNYLIANYNDFDDIEPAKLTEDSETRATIEHSRLVTIDSDFAPKCLVETFATRNYPEVFLLVGRYASLVVVVENGAMSQLDPFYLDKYVCPDIGHSRGMPLFFKEDKYEKMVDAILSGDFTNEMKMLD